MAISSATILTSYRETVLRQADEIPIAPSVGIHMPPRHSLAEELGLGLDGKNHVEGDYDDIDLRIQGGFHYQLQGSLIHLP